MLLDFAAVLHPECDDFFIGAHVVVDFCDYFFPDSEKIWFLGKLVLIPS